MRARFVCLWALTLSSLGVGCGPAAVELPAAQTQMVHADELVCKVDSDCVRIARIDGCGCSAGGYDGVANKAHEDTILQRIQQTYGLKKCLDVMNGDPACVGVRPACVQHRCVLVHAE